MLVIADPNDDRSLLTTAELRAAAGLASGDSSRDAILKPLGDYVSSMIAKACKVAQAGAIEPTLRLETVEQTFHIPYNGCRFLNRAGALILARRPVVEIISVIEGNSTLAEADSEAEEAAGLLYRVAGNCRIRWCEGKIVVTYSAGWDEVPADLKYAAIKFVQAEYSHGGSRDPLLKRVRIEGVSEREYWVDPTKDKVVPATVMDILVRGGYVADMVMA